MCVTSTETYITFTEMCVTSTETYITSTETCVTSTETYITSTETYITSTETYITSTLIGKGVTGIEAEKISYIMDEEHREPLKLLEIKNQMFLFKIIILLYILPLLGAAASLAPF